MLVVTRKADESFVINVQGTAVTVRVLETHRGHVSIGVDAPREWNIRRSELLPLMGSSVVLQDMSD